MTGQHWCSVCEEDLSKHKGTYVKLYWRGTEDKCAEKISVICPDCRKKDKTLDKGLKLLEDVAKPVEVSRGRVCSFCGTPVKKRERSLRAEFRYDGSELRADICERCIDEHEEIKAIHVEAPNPVFNVKVNCVSADICESFKKPSKDRGINCGHVVANMDGELYCRKAHPGHVRIYRERYAIPPSRKKLVKMITELIPLYEKVKNGAQLLAEETSAEPSPIFPDTFEYEIKEFPIEGNRVWLPWNAHIIRIGDQRRKVSLPGYPLELPQTVTVMIAVEKKKEEK